MNDNNPYKSRETLTFSITKETFSNLYKIAEKNSFTTYFAYTILLAVLIALLFLIRLAPLGWAMIALIVVFSLFYLFMFLKTRKKYKHQMLSVENNLYNYTLYPNQLIVTIKNEKYVFEEHIIPRSELDATLTGNFLYFYYKKSMFAIPKRVLNQDSVLLSLQRNSKSK